MSRRESMAKFFVKYKSKHDIATYLWNRRGKSKASKFNFNITTKPHFWQNLFKNFLEGEGGGVDC